MTADQPKCLQYEENGRKSRFFNWWRLYFNLALVAFLATRFVPLDFRHLLVVGMLSFFLETTTFSFCCFLQTAHARHLVLAFDVFYKRRIRVLLGRRVISMNLFQLTLTEIVNFPFQKHRIFQNRDHEIKNKETNDN